MEKQVVISGGGPVGFWLASELQLAGVSTLVLEQDQVINPQSRALTVHPRTIEVLASRGAHEQLLEEGVHIPNGHFAILDERLDFQFMDSPFPFTLAILQARTTELLEQRALALGAEVRRGHRVSGFVESSESVSVAVEASNTSYTVEAEYLAGCDGTKSTVRQSAGIDFPGTDFTVLGWLGDVVLDDPPEDLAVSKWGIDGTLMFVKLPGGRHRFVGITPDDVRTDWPDEFTFEELRSKVISLTGTDYGMHSPSWLSRYGNTTRQAASYRQGRVVLAGDAAHQHMPAGGVGLNVGIQDAMNLGWKLAATINGWAPDGLLDTYHDERHPVGRDLLEHTQAQTALMSAFTTEGRDLRSLLGKLIAELPSLEQSLAKRLAGLSVVYPPTSQEAHALVGHRAPNLTFDNSPEGLFHLLREGQYVLLDLTADHASALQPNGNGPARAHLRVHHGELSQSRKEWETVTAALIRPDGHVAWASETRNPAELAAGIAGAVRAIHRDSATEPVLETL